MKRAIFVVSSFIALFGVLTGASAQQSAGVICNSKSVLTNVRSGPTAKGTSVVEAVPNNTKVTIQERVKNPEGTHDWLRISFRSPSAGGDKQGFVFNDLVSTVCPDETRNATSQPEQTAASSNGDAVDISRDPAGVGKCAGVIIPISLFSTRGVSTRNFERSDFVSANCEKELWGGVFEQKRDGYALYVKVNLPGMSAYGNERCYTTFRVAGFNNGSKNFVEGPADVTLSATFVGRGCKQHENILLIKGQNASNREKFFKTVYFADGRVFLTKSAFESHQNELRENDRRRENQIEQEFLAKLRGQDGAQGLYLFAGQLERESNNSRARQAYEFIISEHPKSEWAVKANDRLLAMRGESDANRRAADTQIELSRNREQAVQLCRNRRIACTQACSNNNRSYADIFRCENGCPTCN